MASLVQGFIDSGPGQVLATSLHTLGAIGFLAGLVAYLAWARRLREGRHLENVFAGTVFLTYLSIVMNLLGGFMRNLQTGHPPVWEVAREPWVQVILVKHLFLFASMGAAVVLFHRVAPRLVRAHTAGGLEGHPARDHVLGSAFVAFGIVLATLLGALALVTPIGQAEMEDPDPVEPEPEPEVPPVDRWHNATGSLTSTPATPRTVAGTFDVPEGMALLEASLQWTPAETELRLVLLRPGGEPEDTEPERSSGRVDMEVEDPAPGTWGYRIEADLAVDVSWDLGIRMSAVAQGQSVLAETVRVAPGQFFEINTQMPLNGTLNWDWEAGAVVHFDVHSHFDDEVQYHVEEQTDAHRGSFTNDREGGYSLLWENTGSLPVEVTYRVWGDFEVDSYFPPR